MKNLKMLGLAALAAVLTALVVAGSASATTISKPIGHVNAGDTITAANEGHITLHLPFGSITCAKSTFSGITTTTGSLTGTVEGNVQSLTFTECNAIVAVPFKGSFEIHTQGPTVNNNGTLTSTNTELTVEYFGTHCIYRTAKTDIATVTGAATTKTEHATFDIAATLPLTGGESGVFCGDDAQWTGAYKVTSPTNINVI